MNCIRLIAFILFLFPITIMAIQSTVTNVVLAWNAPTNLTDGEAITNKNEIFYKVHYGEIAKTYTTTITNILSESISISNLPNKKLYFATTAYMAKTNEISGFNESAYSEELMYIPYYVIYSNSFYESVEFENMWLDVGMTIASVSNTTYIGNSSGINKSAMFSFRYKDEPILSNNIALWINSKNQWPSTNYGFRLTIDSTEYITPPPSNLNLSSSWDVRLQQSTNWHWDKLTNVLYSINTNKQYNFFVSITDASTLLDKMLITTNLQYDPNIPPVIPLPTFNYNFVTGTEFILATNTVLLSWKTVPNANIYKIYSVWNDTTTTKTYSYGQTNETHKYIPMSRSGHLYYYVSAFSNTTLLTKSISTNTNTIITVHGYSNQVPWTIYWKLPPPGGIIVE